MSYPNPYGGQAPGGVGYGQPGPSAYPASSAGCRLGFENMPPYPSSGGAGPYGAPPAPGFAQGGYPPQGGGYPPSSGYPPSGGPGYPQSGGYPQPFGGAQSGYPQVGGQGGYPQSGGYGQPPSGQAPLSYPQGGSGGGYGGQPHGAPASGSQPYGANVSIPSLPYSGSGYQHPAPSSGGGHYQPPAPSGGSPYHGSPAPGYGSQGGYGSQQGPAPGYGSQSGGYGGLPAGSQSGGYGGPPAPGYGSGTGSNVGYGGGYSTQAPAPTMAYSGHFQGTVKPSPSFNPSSDCEALKKAMKGFGCDDKAVINVLCYRSNAQRQQIRNTFKTMYGKDLIKELISELRGNLEDLVIALMYTPGEFDARELQNAMAGLGTTESTLIEIMSTRTNAEIRDIKIAYRSLFGKDLENALVSETSGYFKRLLVSLCNGARDESAHVDPARARKSSQDLLAAGVKKWGTDEATFNAILCAQSFPQLQAVFEEYRKLAGHDIEQAIRGEFSGDIEDGHLALVKTAKNAPAFFAERAYNSMVGMGTNDRALIRVIVSRCEKDMVQIKQEFQRMYGKTLDSFISGDTSGKYKEALIALVRGN